jgi:hypothetical protein
MDFHLRYYWLRRFANYKGNEEAFSGLGLKVSGFASYLIFFILSVLSGEQGYRAFLQGYRAF